MKYLVLLLVLAAGVSQPFQVAMNTKLKETSGSPWIAALVSFAGALVVTLLLWASGLYARGSVASLSAAPWWTYLSGPIALLIVVAGLLALPLTSAGLVVAIFVFGQGVASLAVDHYGWLDVKVTPINWWRAAGVVLLFGGVVLMQKK